MYCHVLFMTGFQKSFKRSSVTGPMAKRSRCPAGKPRVAGSIPGRDKNIHFAFFACFPSVKLGGCLANEFKHCSSPVAIVVLYPIYD